MGGISKINAKGINNNPEFSESDIFKTRRGLMVNSGYLRRNVELDIEQMSSDSDFIGNQIQDYVPVKANEKEEPDNWSLYNCLENPGESEATRRVQNPHQHNTSMSMWNHSPMTAQSFMSEDEDDLYLFRPMSSVSSARSSISWAEDAVESEITDQLGSLWEDIERVCSGEEKPSEMSTTVYEECLQWRRAFPQQTLLEPSRFSNVKSGGSTPTPTNNNSKKFFDDLIASSFSVMQDSRPFTETETSVEDCLTPNPNNSSEYVSSWLSDNHQTRFPFYHKQNGEEDDDKTFPGRRNNCTSAVVGNTESDNIFRPIIFKPNHVIEEKPDSSDEDEGNGENTSLRWGRSNAPVKVQRPVSSYAKGHMMTPMRTEPESALQSQPYYSPQAKHANLVKSTPNFGYPNRILSSLPAGRTAMIPTLVNSPSLFSHNRTRETISSGYRYRKPHNFIEQPQKSRATLATVNLNTTPTNFLLPSNSPYWSRYTNSPNTVQEETDSQVQVLFNGDFGTEDSVQPPTTERERPNNLELGSKGLNESGDGKPIKPFLFWLFDRVSPN